MRKETMTKPGEVIVASGMLRVNEGRQTTSVRVINESDRVVYVSSHYHFFEANRYLAFDRRAAYGMRLDVAAGTGVRWAPGEEKAVDLIPLEGRRQVHGFQGFVNGALDDVETALARLRSAGFRDTGQAKS